MTDKQFTFIMQALRDRIRRRIHDREIINSNESNEPFVLLEDVDRALIISFNEILEDEHTI